MSIKDKIRNLFLQKKETDSQNITFSEALNSGQSFNETPSKNTPNKNSISQLEKFYPYILTILISLFTADLSILAIRDIFLPQNAPPSLNAAPQFYTMRIRTEYNSITDRNIFNSDGIIPSPLAGGDGTAIAQDGPAIKSTLPLTLIGTIVHANPGKSVATIQSRSSNDVIPYLPNEEIEGIAYLVKVERRRAIIRNLNNNRLEYLEIPEDVKLSFAKTAPTTPSSGGPFQREGNNFSISRQELNGYLKDLPNLLQQATAVPNIVPGSGGEVDGFRLIAIEPNSVFTQIGLQAGDVLKGVNGERVNSPAKAMELYNSLRNEGKIELEIERNGKADTLSFSVNE